MTQRSHQSRRASGRRLRTEDIGADGSDFRVNGLSVIVPTLNEEGNVNDLILRLDRAISGEKIPYEVIVVDDHSTDATRDILTQLADRFPLRGYLKQGPRGKAYSLLEGFAYAHYNTVVMIDADLQYPPEAISAMLAKVRAGYGVVVAQRRVHHEPLIRRITSQTFTFLFTRVLHGFTCDVQAGLKMFRKQVLGEMQLAPTPWTFDLAFLINARNAGYTIGTVDITFAERCAGTSKVKLARAAVEIGLNALALRFAFPKPVAILPAWEDSMLGAGLAYRGKRFITHTTLGVRVSAFRTLVLWQKVAFLCIGIAVVGGLLFAPLSTGIVLVAIISAIYFFDALFNLYLVRRSLTTAPSIQFTSSELAAITEESLPIYSILCPLYREANVVADFLRALERLDWPKEKLDVLLLLEEDDASTRAVVAELALPSYVRVVIVPDSQPKTKPKACNVGLALARGEYIVIYDAEDLPEPSQLKKAYLAFRRLPDTVKCLQAKLNYFNPQQNLLTRLFAAEYSLWFDLMLPGMQSVATSIPLGGTSNHFRTEDLKALQGWDPFNVTEDCDLGIRLFRRGYTTAIIDSVTLEEANSNIRNWIRQRSRWLKGYLQTYLVHMRNPIAFVREYGIHAAAFQFIVGGKAAFMLINPFMWLATIAYFAANSIFGPTIEALYPNWVLALAVSSLVFGNFLYFYYYMIGCAVRGHWQLIKYVFLIPFYWLLASVAAYVAFYQLVVKPHYWEKTRHGLHVKARASEQFVQPRLTPAPFSDTLSWVRSALFHLLARGQGMTVGLRELFHGSGVMSSGSVLVGAMLVANVLNFAFNAFLGRTLDFTDLSVVALINTLWYVSSQFLGALSATVNHRTAHLASRQGDGSSSGFRQSTLRAAFAFALGLSVVWIVVTPLTVRFFNLTDPVALLLFTPVFVFGVLTAVNRGWLQGSVRFISVAALFFIEAVSKLVFAGLFVGFGFSSWAYLSIPLAVVIVALLSRLFVLPAAETRQIEHVSAFPVRFFWATLVAGISATAFLSLDIVLVKHLVTPVLAGQYALLALAGKVVYFLGALPNVFVITLVGRDIGLGRSPAPTFHKLLVGTVLLVCIGVVALGPMGVVTLPLLFGAKAAAVVPYATTYVLAIGLFTVTNMIVLYHLARKRYVFPVLALIASLAMAEGIVLHHDTIGEVVKAIFVASSLFFVSGVGLHSLYGARTAMRRLLPVAVMRWHRVPTAFTYNGSKRILVFNWRDMRHAFAGGAEVYVERMARQWVADGHAVTLFCGNDGTAERFERVAGVDIVRRGGFYSVYLWALIYYFLYFRGKYDMIIDCHNGIPFFTPLYVREPVFCVMHHVHQEVFRRALIRPLAAFARFLERDLMPRVYRTVPLITVSDSSRQAIVALGLGQGGTYVVPPGIEFARFARGVKSRMPTVLYLGRLQRYKSVDVLLHAFRIVLAYVPDARLVIAGSGEDEDRLRSIALQLRLTRRVVFTGRVDEARKTSLLQRAWVAVNPSFIEGWGITTIEANACGTPVVAADVPGLRDSVRHDYSGLLVPHGDSMALARMIQRVLQDQVLRQRLSNGALVWASQFDERVSAHRFLTFLGAALPDRVSRGMTAVHPAVDGVMVTPVSVREAL